MRDWLAARRESGPFAVDVVVALHALAVIAAANRFFLRPTAALLNVGEEATALAVAKGMIARSSAPYVGGVGPDGPLYYWIVSWAERLLGAADASAARVLVLLCMVLTVGLAFAAAALARCSMAGAIMAIAYAGLCCVGMDFTGGLSLEQEHVANVFGMAALLFASLREHEGPRRRLWPFLSGASLACVALCKASSFLVVVPIGLWVWAGVRRATALSASERRRLAIAFAAGLLGPLVLVALRYVVVGELGTLWRFTVAYDVAVELPSRLHAVGDYWRGLFLPFGYLVAFAAWAGWGFWRVLACDGRGASAGGRGFEATVFACATASLLVALASVRQLGTYFVDVSAWAGLLGGVVLSRAASRPPRDARSFPVRAVVVRALVLLPLAVVVQSGWLVRSRDYRAEGARGAFETASWPVCDFLRERTKSTDSIFTWGIDAAPYVACGRRPASRFVTFSEVAGVVSGVTTDRLASDAHVLRGSRDLMVADLRDDPPAAIVDSTLHLEYGIRAFRFLDQVFTDYCRVPEDGPVWLRKTAPECASTALTRPLLMLINTTSRDCLTAATDAGIADAQATGHIQFGVEGAVYTEPHRGTVPLELFVNRATGEHMTVATPSGEARALAAGYELVRVEGHLFTSAGPGRVPLSLYWNQLARDYCTNASDAALARTHGYELVELEGFLPARDTVPPLTGLDEP